MPLVSASDRRVQEIRRLQSEVAYHKRVIREQKEALHRAKAALAALEVQDSPPQPGEGAIHGHQHARS